MRARTFLQKYKANEGLSLVEMAIVLGVFSVVIAAIWLVVSVVYENVRQYNATRNLQTIVQNARQLWTRVPRLSGTPTNYTADFDFQTVFPKEMRTSSGNCTSASDATCGKIQHPWASSDNVTVTYFDADTFNVTFANLSKKACIGLAVRISGGDITNLEAVVIGTTTYSGTNLPLTPVTADVACSSPTANTITWQFNIRA